MLAVGLLLAGAPALARASNDSRGGAGAAAGGTAGGATGYDISYPQCNGAFPSDAAFAIVGVNAGLVYSPNPCLTSELAWAGMDAALYANTANPGPASSSHWPSGQTSPQECDTPTTPGADTTSCAYDYGWNAAADSYHDALLAYQSLGRAAPSATTTPVANEWWLDVETTNSWRSDASLNIAVLQGAVDYLKSVGTASVGFYSTLAQWTQITGGATALAALPSWVAGATSLEQAQSSCAGPGFTGGPVVLAQYPGSGFNADYRCPSSPQPALAFATPSQTLTAGSPSTAMQVQLPEPAATQLEVTLSSSSATGTFSASASGPWSSTLAVTIPTGASASSSFSYQDTKTGSPTLKATATGYGSAVQSEAVIAAALASMSVSPRSATVALAGTQSFSASGSDAYGNPVSVASVTWSTTAAGTLTPTSGPATTFTASSSTAGNGSVTATAGSVAGSASLHVIAASPPGLTRYGQAIWNLEALLHDTFGSKTVYLQAPRSRHGPRDFSPKFNRACCSQKYSYTFTNARHSAFRAVRPSRPPRAIVGASGLAVPLTIKGAYISCGANQWLYLHLGEGAANWQVSCHP